MILTQAQLIKKCREWQKILRLQDWDIDVKISREWDFIVKGRIGEISHNHEHKHATVRLLDPIDYDPDSYEPQDMEIDLVHELLHLHFPDDAFNLQSNWEILYEQAINRVAEALVKLKREAGK